MSTIQVITCMGKNEKTGKKEEVISHGVDLSTGKIVVMEQVAVRNAGYLKGDPDLGWVINHPG